MSDKIAFTSNMLPDHLGEKAKFNRWQDIHIAEIWSVEYGISDRMPFEAGIETKAVGDINLGQMSGTIKQASRKARDIARDSRDGYLLLINTGQAEMVGSQVGRQYRLRPGDAALVSASEAFEMTGGELNVWSNIVIPTAVMMTAFRHVEDRLAMPVDADNDALRLLRRYGEFLDRGAPLVSPELIAHASQTIVDLVGIATGLKGAREETGSQRGLRAARLAAVLEKIRTGYTNPMISANSIAFELGLSARYVHDLLQETGNGFSERVLELRLLRVRDMLSTRAGQGLRIGEIALACGFNDISYFNRSFRRRFGTTPSAAR